MGFLGVLGLVFEVAWFGQGIFLAICHSDQIMSFLQSLTGEVDTVRTHVGDQTHRAIGAYGHPLVQLLGSRHGFFCTEAQLAGGLLL